MKKKMRLYFAGFLAVVVTAFGTGSAFACPECQYEQCAYTPWGSKIGCACLPNSGCVIKAGSAAVVAAANPLPDILNIGGAAVSGNLSQLSQSIGKSVIDGCIVCGMSETLFVSQEDKPFIESVIGRGFIEFVTTENPYIVVADAATSIATKTSLKEDPNPLIAVASPPLSVTAKAYLASPSSCLVESDSQSVVAGWVDGATFTDQATGAKFTYPNIQFNPGDTVTLSSTNTGCPNLGQPLKLQHYVNNVTITYGSDSARSGSPTQMKQFVLGKATNS